MRHIKSISSGVLLVLLTWTIACKEEKPPSITDVNVSKISSPEFENDLLFVNRANFQIQTTEPAQFSSTASFIQISPTGQITRLTSGEIAPIDIKWTTNGTKTRIYALGATDSNHDQPYARFHGVNATDPYTSYRQGWQTLQRLPVTAETYAIILRHADADAGRDRTNGPANWWTSCDAALARQLNDHGKQRATELGNVFKDLQLPITRIISSEFCRAKSTAELMNIGAAIKTDGRINHPEYNRFGSLFNGMLSLMNEQPVDNKITLIVTHHPINETRGNGYPSFPNVSPFTWTGAYLIKISPDKTITYQGAVSWSMFKYWRDKKLVRL